MIRSKYDCILSSYKSVNKDNSILNCRINGLEHLSPSRAIIDRDMQLKRKLNIYNSTKKIKTYLFTSKNDKKKENFLKSKNIIIIKIRDKKKILSFKEILFRLKGKGFSRILCESGLYTTKAFLKKNLFYNLYVFKSFSKLNKNGRNSYKNLLSKLKLKDKKKIDVKLFGDELYKLRIK